jgi:hypothetical protein
MSLREQARAVVALAVAAEGIRQSIDHDILGWEDYPEIGEDDWNRIVVEAILISVKSRPDADELADALRLLVATEPSSYAEFDSEVEGG